MLTDASQHDEDPETTGVRSPSRWLGSDSPTAMGVSTRQAGFAQHAGCAKWTRMIFGADPLSALMRATLLAIFAVSFAIMLIFYTIPRYRDARSHPTTQFFTRECERWPPVALRFTSPLRDQDPARRTRDNALFSTAAECSATGPRGTTCVVWDSPNDAREGFVVPSQIVHSAPANGDLIEIAVNMTAWVSAQLPSQAKNCIEVALLPLELALNAMRGDPPDVLYSNYNPLRYALQCNGTSRQLWMRGSGVQKEAEISECSDFNAQWMYEVADAPMYDGNVGARHPDMLRVFIDTSRIERTFLVSAPHIAYPGRDLAADLFLFFLGCETLLHLLFTGRNKRLRFGCCCCVSGCSQLANVCCPSLSVEGLAVESGYSHEGNSFRLPADESAFDPLRRLTRARSYSLTSPSLSPPLSALDREQMQTRGLVATV